VSRSHLAVSQTVEWSPFGITTTNQCWRSTPDRPNHAVLGSQPNPSQRVVDRWASVSTATAHDTRSRSPVCPLKGARLPDDRLLEEGRSDPSSLPRREPCSGVAWSARSFAWISLGNRSLGADARRRTLGSPLLKPPGASPYPLNANVLRDLASISEIVAA
jgi:hypothetical protein